MLPFLLLPLVIQVSDAVPPPALQEQAMPQWWGRWRQVPAFKTGFTQEGESSAFGKLTKTDAVRPQHAHGPEQPNAQRFRGMAPPAPTRRSPLAWRGLFRGLARRGNGEADPQKAGSARIGPARPRRLSAQGGVGGRHGRETGADVHLAKVPRRPRQAAVHIQPAGRDKMDTLTRPISPLRLSE